jgi:hypothetical protein
VGSGKWSEEGRKLKGGIDSKFTGKEQFKRNLVDCSFKINAFVSAATSTPSFCLLSLVWRTLAGTTTDSFKFK